MELPVLAETFSDHDGQHAVHMPSNSLEGIDDGDPGVVAWSKCPLSNGLGREPDPRSAPNQSCGCHGVGRVTIACDVLCCAVDA